MYSKRNRIVLLKLFKNKQTIKMKQPYQIRIEKDILEKLKNLAKKNGTSVNHEIRQAIRGMLDVKKI